MSWPAPELQGEMLHEFYQLGTKKELDLLWPGPQQPPDVPRQVLNLGSGKNPIPGAVNLDIPDWRAPWLTQFKEESVTSVHMHHFLEHLSAEDVYRTITEVSRVLVPRGVIFITVPHAGSQLAFQAVDHRTFWTEESMQDLFYSRGYDAQYGLDWKLDIAFMTIMAREFRNLQLLVQLVKADENGRRIKSSWTRS